MKELNNIKLKGYRGTWGEIDRYRNYILLEHEYYGDEVPNIWIDEQYNIIMDESYNGIIDLEDLELV